MCRQIGSRLALLSALGVSLSAWVDDGFPRWPDDTTVTLHLQLQGLQPTLSDGRTYNQAAATAVDEWNRYLGRLRLAVVQDSTVSRGESGPDALNQVYFASTVRGTDFGEGIIAVAYSNWLDGRRVESDVVFNSNYTWDSYHGSRYGGGPFDVKRVALHEFGHVVGLGHPDQAGQVAHAVMNSIITNVEMLQEDDILGAFTLWGAGPDTPRDPPWITHDTPDLTVVAGGAFTVTVTARGFGLRYQWQKDGVDVPGATGALFRVDTVRLGDAGRYACLVSNPFGVVRSREILVQVLAYGPPTVMWWAQGPPAVMLGDAVTLIVRFEGSVETLVEWWRNGQLIRRRRAAAGGTGLDELVIAQATGGDAGTYSVRVTTPGGTAETPPVIMALGGRRLPRIGRHPIGQTGTGTMTLEVQATGSGLAYQWLREGQPIAGAQSATYSFTLTAATAGSYSVRVTDSGGTVESDPAFMRLRQSDPPVIAWVGGPTQYFAGETMDLRMAVQGTAPISIQWYRDNQPVGAPKDVLDIVAVPGAYRCEVSNSVGSAGSHVLMVEVDGPVLRPAQILTQPASWTVAPGEAHIALQADFDVSTTGRVPGQWFRNGTPLPGGTRSRLELGLAMLEHAGEYYFECQGRDGLLRTATGVVSVEESHRAHPIMVHPPSANLAGRIRATLRPTSGTREIVWEKNGNPIFWMNTDNPYLTGPAYDDRYVLVVKENGQEYRAPAVHYALPAVTPAVRGAICDVAVAGPGLAIPPWNLTSAGVPKWLINGTAPNWSRGFPGITDYVPVPPAGTDYSYAMTWGEGATAVTQVGRIVRSSVWPLVISQHPASITLAPGASGTLWAEGNREGDTVRWRRDGVDLPGVTGSSLLVSADPTGEAHRYEAVVSYEGQIAVSTSAWVRTEPLFAAATPVLLSAPALTTLATGATLRLTPVVDPGARSFLTFGWSKDGVALPEVTGPTLIIPNAQLSDSGTYRVTLDGQSRDMVVQVRESARLVNISARAHAGTGDAIVIPSFVVTGEGERRLMVRVAGDTLYPAIPAALRDPVLQFKRMDGTLLDQDDDWESDPVRGETLAQLMQARCGGVLKRGSRDAALLRAVPAGNYTPHVSGKNLTTGVAVTEVFDLTEEDVPARVVNMAARAKVEAGDGLLILGFVIGPGEPRRLMITGIGPTLTGAGVAGALADPKLTLYDAAGKELGSNDNWSADATEARALEEAFLQTGAGYLTRGTLDAAMIVTLPPGAYSAHVRDTQGRTGIAISELWELP